MSGQIVDPVEALLALGNLPPGNSNPFDVRTMSPNVRRFQVSPDTWDGLREISDRINGSRDDGQERTVSPSQIGSVLLEVAVEERREPTHHEEVTTAALVEEISANLVPRLESRGGRPAVPEWSVSRLTGFDLASWDRLHEIARLASTKERKVSAGQVASYLIEKVLGEL